jgi:hypothetical protein
VIGWVYGKGTCAGCLKGEVELILSSRYEAKGGTCTTVDIPSAKGQTRFATISHLFFLVDCHLMLQQCE